MNRLAVRADQDLLRALAGLTAVRRAESGTQSGEPDITAVLADGRVVQIEVKSLAKPSSPEIDGHLRAWRSEAERSGRVLVLVADQIPRAARDALAHAGLSYLDRRGRLFLHGPGLIVERDLEADMAPPRAPTPSGVRGLGGTAAALAALVRPDSPPGIRETARFAALSHTAVHRGQRALREAGLLEEDGRPVTPDLFEALVRAWAIPQAVVGGLAEGEEYRVEAACGAHLESPLFETLDDLAGGLAPIDPRSGIDPLGGWALTGTLAAAEYGAPVVVGRGARPEVLVPAGTSPRVTAALGSQLAAGDLGMVVTEAPSALATRLRRRGNHRIPLAHPVVVAVELARDEARGREILEGFAPVGVTRVWA